MTEHGLSECRAAKAAVVVVAVWASLAAACGGARTKVVPAASTDDSLLNKGSTISVRAGDVESAVVTDGSTVAIALPFEQLPDGTSVDNWSKHHTDDSHLTGVLFAHVPVGTNTTAPISGRAQRRVLRYPASDGSVVETLVITIESDPPAGDGTRLVLQLFASAKSEMLAALPDVEIEPDRWTNVTVGSQLFRITDSASLSPAASGVAEHNLEMHAMRLTDGNPQTRGPIVGFLRDRQSRRWILVTSSEGRIGTPGATPLKRH